MTSRSKRCFQTFQISCIIRDAVSRGMRDNKPKQESRLIQNVQPPQRTGHNAATASPKKTGLCPAGTSRFEQDEPNGRDCFGHPAGNSASKAGTNALSHVNWKEAFQFGKSLSKTAIKETVFPNVIFSKSRWKNLLRRRTGFPRHSRDEIQFGKDFSKFIPLENRLLSTQKASKTGTSALRRLYDVSTPNEAKKGHKKSWHTSCGRHSRHDRRSTPRSELFRAAPPRRTVCPGFLLRRPTGRLALETSTGRLFGCPRTRFRMCSTFFTPAPAAREGVRRARFC